MAIRPRKFQHAFGRSTKTKALDNIWNNRNGSLNIKQLSEAIGQSYQYAVLVTEDLKRRGLIVKEENGAESILKPNPKNLVMKRISTQR